MSELRRAIDEAYKTALNGRDENAVRTLRLLNSELKRLEIDERRTATEQDVLAILQRSIKKRREAIEAGQSQGRDDVVRSETAELEVLQRFLPAQLSEAELVGLVDAAIAETGASQKRDQGRVMNLLMPRVQGRADGKLVAKLVSERLQ